MLCATDVRAQVAYPALVLLSRYFPTYTPVSSSFLPPEGMMEKQSEKNDIRWILRLHHRVLVKQTLPK